MSAAAVTPWEEIIVDLDLTLAVEAAAEAHFKAFDILAIDPLYVTFEELATSDPMAAHAYREHVFEAVVAAVPVIAREVLRAAAGQFRAEASARVDLSERYVAPAQRLDQMASAFQDQQ